MFWHWLKDGLAWRFRSLKRRLSVLFNLADFTASLAFVCDTKLPVGFLARLKLIFRFYEISLQVDSPHRQWEILTFVREILRHPKGSGFVEAGSFKGASAAKFSSAAALVDAKLYVFDSFEGIPDNAEPHDRSIFGEDLRRSFVKGTYAGSLDEVQSVIRRFGSISHCEFIKGWFENTMPDFRKPLSGAYVDVDLASSTRTCIKYLFPLLRSGSCLMSQDGHIPLVIEIFRDQDFWRTQLGLATLPTMQGVGTSKLIIVTKP